MYNLGIDLGGTNIAVGVVDENYNIVGRGKVKTGVCKTEEDVVMGMAKAAKMAVEDAGLTLKDIAHVGVGSPGSVDTKNGIVLHSNNIRFKNLPMKAMLEKELDNLPTYLDNDANAAAYGEMIAGAGKGAENFIAITLGTGVGSGIVVDGKMLPGVNCAVGEMGHTVIVVGGEECTCGRKGCFEAYASATALIRQAKRAMEADKSSKMWDAVGGDIEKVDGKVVFDSMHAGDETAKKVVDTYLEYVACGITNIINTFQPEILCIGGGISNQGEVILAPIREYVKKYRYSQDLPDQTVIKTAELGNDAGIIGAALLYKLYEK